MLFIYSLINYYTAFSHVTLRWSLGGASSHGAAGQGVGVCRDPGTLPARGRGSSCTSGCPGSASLSLRSFGADGSSQPLSPCSKTRVETLTGYSTSALARLISSPKASFAAQHPLLAIPSACQNTMQTAQGSLVTRPAQEGN